MATYLVSVDRIKKNTFLDNNVSDKIIKLALLKAQDEIMEPTLGTKLYEKLLSGIDEGEMELTYQNLIVQYIWKPLYYAASLFVYRHLVWKETNNGILQGVPANQTGVDVAELNTLRDEAYNSMEFHIQKLQRYLTDNSTDFPEYFELKESGLESEESSTPLSFYYSGPLTLE